MSAGISVDEQLVCIPPDTQDAGETNWRSWLKVVYTCQQIEKKLYYEEMDVLRCFENT